jgi:hypothetical protein
MPTAKLATSYVCKRKQPVAFNQSKKFKRKLISDVKQKIGNSISEFRYE